MNVTGGLIRIHSSCSAFPEVGFGDFRPLIELQAPRLMLINSEPVMVIWFDYC